MTSDALSHCPLDMLFDSLVFGPVIDTLQPGFGWEQRASMALNARIPVIQTPEQFRAIVSMGAKQ